ncbi:MAG TPA: glycosyltransferase family 4 protein [Rhodothermales bacterium]
MRLLYVSHSFPPANRPLSNVGGMQRVATELYRALARRNDIQLEALVLRSSWRWTHVRVIPFMIRVLYRLSRLGRTHEVDLVLFSSMVTAALAIPFRRRFKRMGIQTAAIVHGRDVTMPVGVYQRLVGRIFAALDLILPISEAVEHECMKRGAQAGQIRRIPNGIDLSRYDLLLDRESARIRLQELMGRQLSDDALVLCSVGRQVRRKGFAWFAEFVLPRLPEQVVYVLAGDGPEGQAIQEAARRAGTTSRLFMIGRVDEADLGAVYRGSDLFVMPNIPIPGDMEGFGVVMLEAGVNGLPTVASALEGIKDVIRPGVNGHLLEPMDAAAFADAIMEYVDERSRLDVAASRARVHVRDTFGWEAVADRYIGTLATLLPLNRRPAGTVLPLAAQPVRAVAEQVG